MRWLALVALATVATALPDMFMGRRRGGFTSHLHENKVIDPSRLAAGDLGSGKITQKLDHFDAANAQTWEQRYFFNHEYVKAGSNVNIIYLTGEQDGGLAYIVGVDNSYVYYAEQLNADLYTLEHRYYGGSHPTKDLSTPNLKYLTSQQAIEDIADFIRFINTQKGGDQKWIVVGGSYAGALSAWCRLKHPELFTGSIASSGPVLAQLDFYGYLQTVDEDFKKIGGLCYDQISAGLIKADNLLQSAEGRETLTNLFKITPPLSAYNGISDLDKDTFFSWLINPFESSAQYSQPSVKAQCDAFTAKGASEDPLEAFKLLKGMPKAININFTAQLDELTEIEYKGDTSSRLWFYQTCVEFGYFQSTNRGSNVFGQTQSSNQFIEICEKVYGIKADQIQKNIEYTNQYYGERDYYKGTNVIFSHGTQDPWSFLAKKSDPAHPSVIIVEVDGGDHCSDIGLSCFVPGAKCTKNMEDIQTTTLQNMKSWINPTVPVPDSVEITDNVGKAPLDPLSLPINAVAQESTKLRSQRSIDVPKVSKKIDFTKWNKFTGKQRKGLLPPQSDEKIELSATLGQDWFVQTWDHFNATEKRTFKQQWFYNYKFGSGDGPNFLMIGGEGPESISWVQNEQVAWSTYAKAVGANLFLLEHRYYGKSKLGTNDLQYLTSSQMLYDVATFIRAQTAQQKLTGPWITFGGSYPGALAAWSREWFPELILGAVGSSGPVWAKNDFYEYLEVVEDVIKRQSQNCYDRTAAAFESLHKLAQDPEGRATIQKKFVLEPAWTNDPNFAVDPLDLNNVMSALYGMYQGIVQYNSVDWSDVTELCSVIENKKYTDPLDALSALRFLEYGTYALSSDYDDDLQYYINMKNSVDGNDHKYSDDDLAGVLWTWQTCNEFGYYQTTDYGEGIFGTPVPVNYFVIMCEKVFGIGMDQLESGIAAANYAYGGRNRYDTTNVVLPNGDGDPWHALGITEQGNMDSSVVPILIPGTSHCADMYGAERADPPELTQARKDILVNIQKWLAPAPKQDPYCPCGVDSSGSPVGWKYDDLWIDVVVVLDASEAMGATNLNDAAGVVDSFVSSLITDKSAPLYTRVGVISMADTATVLYKLGMSKTDKVQGKVSIKKGVAQIDVVSAFNAASSMFDTTRPNTRQAIYYMTASNPSGNLNALSQFKSSGVIIVNNYGTARPALKDLASDGQYFTDSNYKKSLQGFCKANCFCAVGQDAYGGSDPAITASGGCYKASAAAAPFTKARSACASPGNGFVAAVHDDAKGRELMQLLSATSSKSDYYWIGYQKLDTGSWQWEDKSTDPYTNWDVNEPSGASVANCAYADSTTNTLPWAAGNCNTGFPYVCEYAPCSTGHKC